MNGLECLLDPVLRAPIIGSVLMCLIASLVGVIIFVQRRSLLAEMLSHAAYPGLTGAIVCAGALAHTPYFSLLVVLSAAAGSLGGFLCLEFLEKHMRVPHDAALCAVLALFVGAGTVIASYAQSTRASLFREIQHYLYGQPATLTDPYILLYAILALVVIGGITLLYKEILTFSFDRSFARTSGMATRGVQGILTGLIVSTLIIGMRSVGIILTSAMLVAPATAARQFTNRLSRMFVLAGGFGMVSGFGGVYLSLLYPEAPAGPLIVLVSGLFALYGLLFAPQRGLLVRYWRAYRFRALRMQENLLKLMWHVSRKGENPLTLAVIVREHCLPAWRLRLILSSLRMKGWLRREGTTYTLTSRGITRGGQIVRLHRLWEVYLVHALGVGSERVHASAEEMEHILTPDLERRLTALLNDPKQDPHEQPIPTLDEVRQDG